MMVRNKYLHLLRLLGNERRSRDELVHIQNLKLKKLFHHAYENVAMYRNKFQEIGLHPEDIRSVEDMQKLPVIDKKDFYASGESDTIDSRISARQGLLPLMTSGSSGETLKFYVDRAYDQFRKAQFQRPYLTNGTRFLDRVMWFRGRPEVKKTLHRRLGLFREYQVYSGDDSASQIRRIQKIRPSILRGYGSVLALIGSKIIEEKISIRPPRLVFTDSELLTQATRSTIEEAFKTKALDIYGTFETENIAYECVEHRGYHIAMDCVIMEFIKNGRQVEPGEEGEIVCTVLDNFTTPFIRYNLHDIGAYSDQGCPCGRTFPMMTKVSGRTQDYAIRENGEKMSSTTFLAALWPLAGVIREFQIIQEEVGLFKMSIVPGTAFSEDGERRVREAIWQSFPEAQIHIAIVDGIEREKSGKFRAFKSMVGKETLCEIDSG